MWIFNGEVQLERAVGIVDCPDIRIRFTARDFVSLRIRAVGYPTGYRNKTLGILYEDLRAELSIINGAKLFQSLRQLFRVISHPRLPLA